MISTEIAKQLILTSSKKYKKKIDLKKIENCLGHVLAEPVKALCFSPPFDQSAMDGYAVNTGKSGSIEKFVLEQKIEFKAGVNKNFKLKINSAIRIFTGATVPKDANLVIPQEFVSLNTENTTITVLEQKFKPNDNIRKKGTQFKLNAVLLKKGEILTASKIALAASAGHAKLPVISFPKVSIIVSGDELVAPGSKIKNGQIFESNSVMLCSLLKSINIGVQNVYIVCDDEKKLTAVVKKALLNSDVILLSGGISVGKYDLVKQVLEKLKTKTIFHKIKQKPGKPLYFGQNKDVFIFGLPGNPAASLTCFYEYVQPFLLKISGKVDYNISVKTEVLLNGYKKKAGLTHYLKGKIKEGGVLILNDQESYKLTSFCEANCLITIQDETEEVKKGDLVECHLI